MLAFASGGSLVPTSLGSTAEQDIDTWLPSFNLKLDLTDSLVFRFGASRAMARPDMGYLKNFTSIGITFPSETDATDPRWVKNSSGDIVGINPSYGADSQNPFLEPTTADQIDFTLENYFADVGSFSLELFYKKFYNYIQYGSYNRDVTLNGVTNTVEVTGPIQGDGAKIKGFEVAFQRYFDFLPCALRWPGHAGELHLVQKHGHQEPEPTIVSNDGSGGTAAAAVLRSRDSIQTDAWKVCRRRVQLDRHVRKGAVGFARPPITGVRSSWSRRSIAA